MTPPDRRGCAEALARLARGPDAVAWALLIERCGPASERLALRLCGTTATAHDALQEAWLQIRDGARHYHPRGDDPDAGAWGWIMRVTANACWQWLRRERRHAATALVHEPAAVVPEEPLDPRLALAVRGALESLPEDQRTAIALHVLEGLDFATVAAAAGCSVAAAKMRVQRGLQRLKDRFSRDPALADWRGLQVSPGLLLTVLPPAGGTASADLAGLLTSGAKPLAVAPAVAAPAVALPLVAGAAVLAAGIGTSVALRREPVPPPAPPVAVAPAADSLPPLAQPWYGTWVATGQVDPVTGQVLPLPAGWEVPALEIAAGRVQRRRFGGLVSTAMVEEAATPATVRLASFQGATWPRRLHLTCTAEGLVVREEGGDPRILRYERRPGRLLDGERPDLASAFQVAVQRVDLDTTVPLRLPPAQRQPVVTITLSMSVAWPKTLRCYGQACAPQWTEAVTDTGESLLVPGDPDPGNGSGINNGVNDHQSLGFQVVLPQSKQPATRLRRLRGVLPMTCEVAPPARVDFAPLSAWIGRSQAMPGTTEAITLLDVAGERLRFDVSPTLRREVRRWYLLGTDGGEIFYTRQEFAPKPERGLYRDYGRPVPVDGTLRCTTWGPSAIVLVPVTFTDLPLQATPPSAAEEPRPLRF